MRHGQFTFFRKYVELRLLILFTVVAAPAAAQGFAEEAVANLDFRTIGPVTMSGRIVDIAVTEINPYTFYVASATGGVFVCSVVKVKSVLDAWLWSASSDVTAKWYSVSGVKAVSTTACDVTSGESVATEP